MRRSLLILLVALAGIAGCEGDGGGSGSGLVIRSSPTVQGCTPIPALSPFPSGLAVLSEATGLAVLAQLQPNALVVFDLDADPDRPRIVATEEIGLDSDGDGQDDAATITPILGFPLYPVPGGIAAVDDTLALLSTSNYEQLLAVDPRSGARVALEIEVPAAIPPERFPLLPTPGNSATRFGLSTLACVFPPDPVDSDGNPIGADARCDAGRPGFLTNLTAGHAVAGGRLFVATSNLIRSGRFLPGTVLVFDWIPGPGGLVVRPAVDTPFLYTSGYNPTGLVRIVTPEGRELVLVVVTGAIGTGSGASNIATEAFVDVIDPSVPRVVATIPLGLAGPAFEAPAVDPGGRIAWLGASSDRQAYAVDLRVLDTPALYAGSGPPVMLDGLTIGFDDARVFTADFPLELPRRTDGRASTACEGLTDVSVDAAGASVLASDFCDGTLTRIAQDLSGAPPPPWPRDRFQVIAQTNAFAPNDAVGEVRAPSRVVARPGVPGVDYTTADVWVVVGQPDGQLCGVRIDSR
jgi:hypothetical protein